MGMVNTGCSHLTGAVQRIVRDALAVDSFSRNFSVDFLGLPPGIEMSE